MWLYYIDNIEGLYRYYIDIIEVLYEIYSIMYLFA